MQFIELNRCFAVISKEQESNLEIGMAWGHKVAGWLRWEDSLKYDRVVLLAEASSGKTEEFKNQARALAAQGKAAFFIRIEDLADEGFEEALDPSEAAAFEVWKENQTGETGWFFLDSVDEARLNRKSVERALRHLAKELGRGLERAHVYISCRASDWKCGEDRTEVERLLPVYQKPEPPAQPEGEHERLLNPIFNKENRKNRQTYEEEEEPVQKLGYLLVVQLTPLSAAQQHKLAVAASVDDPEDFVAAIVQHGLDAYAERPGDLLDLAEYWKCHKSFGSLVEMTENSICRKLSERDKFRGDNNDLTYEKSRTGGERLAAALTLGKSYTLRAAGHEPDPSLAQNALDPTNILNDWTDAERNALTRRGIFAPATYGRIRFHHRGTQEYLTACWFDKLLQSGCPEQVIWDLIFKEAYGVKTLVPSLHAPAAWLAIKHPSFRDEIIQREPIVLLRYGDSRSFPLEAKERLLLNYATRHAAGEISNDSLDHRSIWMFATPELSVAIRRAWELNHREDFRSNLLGLIREAKILECIDLARLTALEENADDYFRTVALQALVSCDDQDGLSAAATWTRGATGRISPRLCPYFATILFPSHLLVDDLLNMIRHTPKAREESLRDIDHEIYSLWELCPAASREQLMDGLSNLVLSPPFKDSYRRTSAQHHGLAVDFTLIAKEVLVNQDKVDATDGLIHLLMAIERSDQNMSKNEDMLDIRKSINSNRFLKRKLFWADVGEIRQNTDHEDTRPVLVNEIFFYGDSLWALEPDDLAWLYDDISGRDNELEQQTALSAAFRIIAFAGIHDVELPKLRELIFGNSILESDLNKYLTPVAMIETEEHRKLMEKHQKYVLEAEERERKDKDSWVAFCSDLEKDPSVLYDSEKLASWSAGAYRLHNLCTWLQHRAYESHLKACMQWRLIEEGFSRPIAEAYRDGLKVIWRVTLPERPTHKGNNQITVKHTTILSIAGLGVEAEGNADWAQRLSASEAERAVQHACISEQGYQNWFDDLVQSHPSIALPILRKTIQNEWSGNHKGRCDFLSHYAGKDVQIQEAVNQILFETITGKKPRNIEILGNGIRILPRLKLEEFQQRKIVSLARRRLQAAQSTSDDKLMILYITMMYLIDADAATQEFFAWISNPAIIPNDSRVAGVLVALFGRYNFSAPNLLGKASVASLESLLRLAHNLQIPVDDSDNLDGACNTILSTLINRPGADAYRALRTLADDPAFRDLKIRFKELARGKAEIDSEPSAWNPSEVITLESEHVEPAKTGDALLKIVMGILSDIKLSFSTSDATSRALLERAQDEDEVQKWLAEQMSLRSQGRFHAHREAHIALGDKPDIIISSTAAQFEVAVEIKNANMGWSVRYLEKALKKQLAEDYLKPSTRRHGVLVISYHRSRSWRDPDTNEKLGFRDLIDRLQQLASSINMNKLGAIELRVFGVDTTVSN
ncbi:hypothetical protein F6V30_14430 [Oryzomonas sagensis]|uniref:ATP-binding protein n=1 Tax=Oryzomonas sagensis TaxID=2603857 RepID=A0ABQ6TLA8_9BACT|nr:hypothetical protein [Oryzomonas sagensis]KAB0669030.1 hypothetical protein F6V30_14430 [Oryzomonas sagensis]